MRRNRTATGLGLLLAALLLAASAHAGSAPDWLHDLARKALAQIQECVRDLIGDRLPPERSKELVASLTEGRWTHDYPITFDQAQSLGLPVRKELPADVYALMDLYPQPRQGRPSVQFVPLPYRREPEPTAQRPR